MSDSEKSSGQPLAEGLVLGPDDRFPFTCGDHLQCFTECCRDVSIFLTPYDALRLRRRLGLSSRELLERHTLVSQGGVVPLVMLRMDEESDKRCPFVSQQGCTIYEDRPWACRMYPLDLGEDGGYRIAVPPERCQGLNRGEAQQRVRAYLESQGTEPYVAAERAYANIIQDPRLGQLDVDNPAIFKMVFMATYNLDAFRDFVFESSFLSRFQVPAERVEAVKEDDEALLEMGYDWLAFGLFGQMNFQIYEQAAQDVEQRVGKPPASSGPEEAGE